ncbi:MAG: 3-oxoacyl-ACP reductase family protein [Myxococcota bacterium]
MLLENRIALVTGAGAGMGKAIALRYAAEGASVVIAEIAPEGGKQVASEIAELGRRALLLETDVASLAQIDALIEQTVEAFGRIDVLVNNAGVTRSLGFFDVTEADWDRIHSVNAKGLFFCMQAAARQMQKQGSGRIINIASIAGKGYRGTSNIAYAGSKGAVIAMTRVGASQLARYDITVNAICPGVTRTSLFDGLMREVTQSGGISEQDFIARVEASIPLRRSNTPDDIAELALFLASDAARNVTGQSWNVDGGLIYD